MSIANFAKTITCLPFDAIESIVMFIPLSDMVKLSRVSRIMCEHIEQVYRLFLSRKYKDDMLVRLHISQLSWLMTDLFFCEICHKITDIGEWIRGFDTDRAWLCKPCVVRYCTQCSDQSCRFWRLNHYMCKTQACACPECCYESVCGVDLKCQVGTWHGMTHTEHDRRYGQPTVGYHNEDKPVEDDGYVGNRGGYQNMLVYAEFRMIIGQCALSEAKRIPNYPDNSKWDAWIEAQVKEKHEEHERFKFNDDGRDTCICQFDYRSDDTDDTSYSLGR